MAAGAKRLTRETLVAVCLACAASLAAAASPLARSDAGAAFPAAPGLGEARRSTEYRGGRWRETLGHGPVDASRPGQQARGGAGARRIVSIVPALTEMLFAIGAGPEVVAVSNYDTFPPEVKSRPRVGALLDPDMERILSLRPDMVVLYGSQTDLLSQLARAGIRTFSYRHAGLPGVFSAMRELASSIGRAQDGQRVAVDLQAQLDRVRRRVQGRRRPRTLLVFERDPASLRGLYVSGGRGFLHDMLEVAGGANLFADVQREAVQPSQETLLARAPDVIIEVRAEGLLPPADLARERRVWDTLASVPAVRNGRVHVLQGQFLVVPGPRVAQATEALARALHPEAFQ
jgi:iron complex transport system substrate-binding protein